MGLIQVLTHKVMRLYYKSELFRNKIEFLKMSTDRKGKCKNKANVGTIFVSDKVEFRPKRMKQFEEHLIRLMNRDNSQ